MNHESIRTEIVNAMDLQKKEGSSVALVMLDLDHFKAVNDHFGHAAGDAVLKHFATLLNDCAVEADASVGRWGGEEFVVVCRGKDFGFVKESAEMLRKKVESSDFPEIGHITCSVGVTEVKATDTFEEAFDRVDRAMYLSKEGGRNRMTVL